jgi:Holliday junction resolvase-like predicted endonuclease
MVKISISFESFVKSGDNREKKKEKGLYGKWLKLKRTLNTRKCRFDVMELMKWKRQKGW